MTDFNFDDFIEDLKQASRQDNAAARVRGIMEKAFQDPQAIAAQLPALPDDDKILFEDEQVSIWYVHFLPELVVPPHDHLSQVAIGIIRGSERNYLFRQTDCGLELTATKLLAAGDTFYLGPKAIHAATAASTTPCNGIHVYLGELTKLPRSLYDWDTGEAQLFSDEAYDKLKREAQFLQRYEA